MKVLLRAPTGAEHQLPLIILFGTVYLQLLAKFHNPKIKNIPAVPEK
jgi:hypothetical protein